MLQQLNNQKWFYRVLAIGIFSSIFVSSSLAIAKYSRPSKPAPPPPTTIGGGSRGENCDRNTGTELTTLTPTEYVGQTIATDVSVAWFVPNAKPVEFALYQGKNRILKLRGLQSSPGIMKLSVPREKLSVGNTYRWQVVLECNANRPSASIITEAYLEVVPTPSTLAKKLFQTKDSLQRAKIYAEFGLWYNAVSEALAAKDEPQKRDHILTLLKDLTQQEEEVLTKQFPSFEQENLETFCSTIQSTDNNVQTLKNLCYQVRGFRKIIQTKVLESAPINSIP